MLQLMKFPTVREAFLDAFNQAKQMEKEQIEDAFDVGYEASEYGNLLNKGEQYYQQTYGGDHE